MQQEVAAGAGAGAGGEGEKGEPAEQNKGGARREEKQVHLSNAGILSY